VTVRSAVTAVSVVAPTDRPTAGFVGSVIT
jgi:hypothetical protein